MKHLVIGDFTAVAEEVCLVSDIDYADDVMIGGKQVSLEEFFPNRAVVGTPDYCICELERIRTLINPDYLFITPTGVPNPAQQVEELRLFAKEVVPHFRNRGQ